MALIEAPDLPAAALVELKAWLRISNDQDDALLIGALRASIGLCEQSIGQLLLARTVEQILPCSGDWQRLGLFPVVAITAVVGLIADGPDYPLPVDAYAIDIDGDGTGLVRVMRPGAAGRVAVTYRAGLADRWDRIAEPLRQGIMRHAAHLHVERGSRDASAPAAVAALWRPYRRMQL